jgi:hypothetical protein
LGGIGPFELIIVAALALAMLGVGAVVVTLILRHIHKSGD